MQVLRDLLADPAFTGAFINLFFIAATAILAYAGKKLKDWWERKVPVEERERFWQIINEAVALAEQTGADQIGKDKLIEAIDYAGKWLDAEGIAVTSQQLRDAIEIAVLRLRIQLGQGKPGTEPPPKVTGFGPAPTP
jgi:hypothetical protein